MSEVNLCYMCGGAIGANDSFCSNCGTPVKREMVTVLGYKEWFAVCPSVSIYNGDVKVGSVGRNEKVELDIREECILKFKLGMRTARCFVKPGDCVLLSCDRVLGMLTATLTSK